MANAGDANDCVSYLMGNHVIAEMMFRHDPRALLYAPRRKLIWEERFCVTVTVVSALTSAGFSFAALYGSAGSNRTNAMYVTSRSVALVVISAVPIFHSSPTWAEAAALAMVIVQASDAAIGALQRDPMKTTGPAVLAGINLVALILLLAG